MEPILHTGSRVLVSPLPYLFLQPQVGDIVACVIPQTKKVFIKRIHKVLQNGYVVRGDNSTDSLDSRTFGPISRHDILGKVVSIL